MHPSVKQKYEENDFDYIPTAQDYNEENFFTKVKSSKKPVIHKITKVVRTRQKQKEYVYYHETLKSRDFLNSPIDYSRVTGRYEDPEFITNIDPRSNQPRASEILETNTVYEFPWTPNILEQWLAQENFELDDNATYLVLDGQRKYGGYTYDQFVTETFDDLVMIGKFGTKQPEMKAEVRRRRRARETEEPSI